MSTRRRTSMRELAGRSDATTDVDMLDPRDSETDGEEEVEDDAENGHGTDRDMLQTIGDVSAFLCRVEEDGEELASGFQRIPNRRVLPDYFEVIATPVAFSTVRQKVLKKLYASYAEWVRDVAQICHNAQVYNRPSAPIFGAAERLRTIFKAELAKLVAKGAITSEDATLPDLGELPPVEDSPPPGSDADEAELEEEDEDDEEDEEDDEEDEDDDSDDDGRRRKRRSRGRVSVMRRERDDKDDEAYKKRGRPPSVLTPMEARIASLLKGLRKFKSIDGNPLILPFEKLPDKASMPDYYSVISRPIALDHIKKKAKRKKYDNVDAVMMDVELLFDNAKAYNEDESPVYVAATELQKQARVIAQHEKARPDDDFRDEDGKLPLAEINHNGEVWKVGDWVHIRNPNDLAKPIVAQVYRTWQDRSGQRWINACWYYRPEQTVHRYEKHFFEHEVVKTGQYRDHQIEDVIERCFVMFITRFPKGRPRGFPKDKSVYVCESRYNEEKFRFAKIKTWASCVPDEVRERDYEMDMFDQPRRMRKVSSPIKHLLREDAKESDPLPKPTWGSSNAPPIVGAVHRRPREAYESPPPEPSPPPTQTVPVAVEASSDGMRRASMMSVSRDMGPDMVGRNALGHYHGHTQSASPAQYQTHTTASQFQINTFGAGPLQQTPVPVPQQPQHVSASPQSLRVAPHYQAPGYPQPYAPAYAQSPAAHLQTMHNPLANNYHQMSAPPSGRSGAQAISNSGLQPVTMYNPPRPPEVYTLPENVNEALAPELRRQFQHDDEGHVLFFTVPPLDHLHKGISTASCSLGHSARYLAGREEWLAERDAKRKARQDSPHDLARKRQSSDVRNNEIGTHLADQASVAMGSWLDRLAGETKTWRTESGLDGWGSQVKKGEAI